ncbi:MAG: cytochrome C biogenesis protein, partial [Desulfuromonadales bacterium]|nr:cytochrome C biogenesis protein [Desulfuromonadales bacterium]
VEKFHGELSVTLPLTTVPAAVEAVRLRVRSQGCLEDELCYPPTEQQLDVALPRAASGPSIAAADLSSPGSAVPPVSAVVFGGGESPALPAEEAFVFEAIAYDPVTLLVRFTAQPGYYLYRDKFEFEVAGSGNVAVAGVELPDGVIKDDPEFGPVPVYFGQTEIPVRLSRAAGPAAPVTLMARF